VRDEIGERLGTSPLRDERRVRFVSFERRALRGQGLLDAAVLRDEELVDEPVTASHAPHDDTDERDDRGERSDGESDHAFDCTALTVERVLWPVELPGDRWPPGLDSNQDPPASTHRLVAVPQGIEPCLARSLRSRFGHRGNHGAVTGCRVRPKTRATCYPMTA
jgi:hypothetical protein